MVVLIRTNGFTQRLKSGWGWAKKNLVGLISGIAGLVAATAILRLFAFQQYLYNVALVFIIIVLLIANQYGLWLGLVMSVLGFFCLNYFFIPPYYSLFIESWAGVVEVIGFLVASVITSQIAARARYKTREAELRQQETAALNQLNMAVLSAAQAEPILTQVVQQVTYHLQASATLLYLRQPGNNPQLELQARYFSQPHASELVQSELAQLAFQKKEAVYSSLPGSARMAYLPLLRGAEVLGVMVVLLKQSSETSSNRDKALFTAQEQHWLLIIANQAALAVEHARLIEETAQVASLKEADRLKSALLASVSHELRTPLTSIKTAVAGLKDDSIQLEPDEKQEYLEVIDEEADRLGRLISNMLDLSRIEAGTLKPHKGLYSLPEIIGNTLERLSRTAILGNYSVQTRIEDETNLPLVPVDYLQLEQVISNLVENAVKYSAPAKPITIQVSQASRPHSRQSHISSEEVAISPQAGILVEIIDQGVGVPEAELELIFDKFYRVGQTARGDLSYNLSHNVSGSGLGLAICKGIIEAHGGIIWARNRMYGGTIFALWLPLASSQTQFLEE